jgi:uncharacterized protein DUF5723
MRNKLLILILILSSSTPLIAQYGSYGGTDARNIALGNSYTACAIGSEAIGRNPAMLAFGNTKKYYINISIPSISGQIYSNTMSMDQVNYYFGENSRYLDDNEKDKLMNYFRTNDGQFNYHASVTPIALVWKPDSTMGTFAFAMTDVVSGNYYIPSEFVDLVLGGNQPGRTYSFDNLNYTTWWLRSYSLTYSNVLTESFMGIFKNVHFGVSGKVINGFAFSGLDNISSSFHTGDKNVISGHFNAEARSAFSRNLAVKYDFDTTTPLYDFNIFARPAGYGFGLDFGLAAELFDGLNVGFSITDLGFVNWSDNVAVHSVSSEFYIDDLFDKSQLDTLLELTNLSNEKSEPFQTTLPIALRLGASWRISDAMPVIPGNMTVVFDYNQGLNNAPGNAGVPRMSLGSEWQPFEDYPSALIGFTHDQGGHARISLGIGYTNKIVSAYLSTYDALTYSTSSVKPFYSIAFSMKWFILSSD